MIKLVAVFLFLSVTALAQTQPDESGISKTAAAFVQAFNRHDAVAFADTFAKDADFTNALGEVASGRENIARFNEPVFKRFFSEARFTYSVRSIRFLTPQIAVVEVDWEITGSKDLKGALVPLRTGRIDWVMTKEDERWLIKVMHNRQASPCLAPGTSTRGQ
jgi:uncharacterized protein (TIGR02246 family)